MNWFWGGSILAAFGLLLRRLLNLGAPAASPASGLHPLSTEREALYQSVAQELETQSVILGITLNDAIDERDSGRAEISARLVRLCAGEWDRETEVLGGLLKVVTKHMPEAQVAVPLRSLSAHRFKSRTMTDFFRMYELLDQLVFRSKMRFQLQVRVLRRANETLTAEFRKNLGYAERTGDMSPEYWSRLDLLFHDFDLLGKEMLLAFRTFLACLPDSALKGFAADIRALRPRPERVILA
jgi:hypothetical protein